MSKTRIFKNFQAAEAWKKITKKEKKEAKTLMMMNFSFLSLLEEPGLKSPALGDERNL